MTTRVFTVEVTGCIDCPNTVMQFGWLASCSHESLITGDCFKKQSQLYRDNKDAITESCPMYQHSFLKDENK
jgi:hypothetical protein